MKLRELLNILKETSSNIDVPQAWIVGGASRDKKMNKLENVADLDITNGSASIEYLSQEFAETLSKQYKITRKIMDDHSTIFVGNLKMDFSSHFLVPNIKEILKTMGINNPTDMQEEVYSRDFTCNSLLMSLDLKTIYDPTKKGFKDIQDKMIKTCLTPQITLTSNRNRVIRAIYLACKLGFDLDPSIIEFVRSNPETVKISTPKSTTDKLGVAFQKDPNKAAELIGKMNLWSYIPIIKPAYPYYQKYLKGKINAP